MLSLKYMVSLKDMSIRTKVIVSMFGLLVFIGLLSFWVSYMHERKSLLTNMQSNASILNRALIISLTSRKSIGEKVNLQTLVEELSLTEGVFGVWVIENSGRITSATFREQRRVMRLSVGVSHVEFSLTPILEATTSSHCCGYRVWLNKVLPRSSPSPQWMAT